MATATLDWSQCPAVESIPGKRSRRPVVKENQHQGRGAGVSAVCAAN